MRVLSAFILILATVEATKQPWRRTRNSGRQPRNNGRQPRNGKTASTQGKLTGSYPLYTQQNQYYFVEMSFGRNEQSLQSFRLLLDLNSPATYLPNQGCKTNVKNPKNCRGYDENSASSTAKTYNANDRTLEPGFECPYQYKYLRQWGMSYHSEGQYVSDTVWFGSPNNRLTKMEDMRIGLADKIDNMPTDFGVLGLSSGPDTYVENNVTVHFLTALRKHLDKKMFTLFYKRSGQNDDKGGRITFGALDTDNCGPPIKIVPVKEDLISWDVKIDSVIANGKKVALKEVRAIPESMYLGLRIPKHDYLELMKTIGSEVVYKFDDWSERNRLPQIPCNQRNKVNIKLIIGGRPHQIPVNALVEETGQNGMCNIHIRYHDKYPWYLGSAFARLFCQTYYFDDPKHMKIAFSPVKNPETHPYKLYPGETPPEDEGNDGGLPEGAEY